MPRLPRQRIDDYEELYEPAVENVPPMELFTPSTEKPPLESFTYEAAPQAITPKAAPVAQKAAPRKPRRLPAASERKFEQDKIIDGLIQRGATMQQIAEQRKLLDSLSEREFQSIRPMAKAKTNTLPKPLPLPTYSDGMATLPKAKPQAALPKAPAWHAPMAPELPKVGPARYRAQENLIMELVRANPDADNSQIEQVRQNLSALSPVELRQVQSEWPQLVEQTKAGYQQEKGYRDFESKPWLERTYERGYSSLARGGGSLSYMGRQAAGLAGGVANKIANPERPFQKTDFPEWRQFEERTRAELEEEKRRRVRPTLGNEILEGLGESIGPAAVGLGAGLLSGGSLPAMMGVSGGMSALGADWSNPKQAAAQTALSVTTPLIAGMLGGRLAQPLMRRLSSPLPREVVHRGTQAFIGGTDTTLHNLVLQSIWGSQKYQENMARFKEMVEQLPPEERFVTAAWVREMAKQKNMSESEVRSRMAEAGVRIEER